MNQSKIRNIARAMLFVVAMCAGLAAHAITWTTITQGTYQIKSGVNVYWKFTPATDCIIVQQGCADLNWYTTYVADDDFDNNVGFTRYESSGWGSENVKICEVTGGTTYYLVALWPFEDYTVTISEQQEVTMNINEVEPAAGSVLHALENGAGQVLIHANMNARYESVYITSGSLTSKTVSANSEASASTPTGINICEALVDLYEQGLQAGAPLTVHINGLSDNNGKVLYNGTGSYEIPYVAAPKPIDVTDWGLFVMGSTGLQTRKFFSYYPAGDPEAIHTFTFSGNVDPNSVYVYQDVNGNNHSYIGPMLEIGCTTTNDAYYEYIPGTVSGNKVTFDLSGRNFGNFDGKLGADSPPSMKIFNIYDLDGQIALGSGEANAGSYDLPINYIEYSQVNTFDQTWTPSTSLKSASTVSVTYTPLLDDGSGNYNRIASFEGMKFSYTDGSGLHTATVPMSQVTKSTSGHSTTLSCAIPAGFNNAANVTVNVQGIVSTDGFDYSNDAISNLYNITSDENMLTFKPAPGSTLTSLESFKVLTSADFLNVYPTVMINGTNHAPAFIAAPEDGVMTVYVNPAVSIDGKVGNKVSAGTTVTITFPANAFTNGISYSPETVVTYTIGTSASQPEDPQTPTEPSKGIDFVPTITVQTNNNALVSFTASVAGYSLMKVGNDSDVTLSGSNSGLSIAEVGGSVVFTLNTPATAEGTYTLNIPAQFLKYIDSDNNTYHLNRSTSKAHTIYGASSNQVIAEITTNPADGALVESFGTVTFKSSQNLSINFDSTDDPYLRERPDLRVFATVNPYSSYFYVADQNGWGVEITENGVYHIVFPAGFLKVDNQPTTQDLVITYYIGSDIPENPELPFGFTITGPFEYTEGGAYASTGDADFSDFVFNVTGVGADALLAYKLTSDKPESEWINQGYLLPTADGIYTGSNVNWLLYDGFNYTITVAEFATEEDRQMWQNPVNQAEIHFTGTTPAFTYSSVKMVAIEPEPNGTIELTNNTITVTYDAPARVNTAKSGIVLGQGAGIKPFSAAQCNVPGMNYGTVWTLTLDPEYLATVANIDVSIYATDESGKVVRGNMELDHLDYYSVSYRVNSGVDTKAVTVKPADGDEIGRIKEIVISCGDLAVGRDFNTAGNLAYIEAPDGSQITFDSFVAVPVEEGSEVTTVSMILENSVAVDGEYKLVIPAHFFIIGSEYTTYGNKAVELTFTVSLKARTDVNHDGKTDSADLGVVINMITGTIQADESGDVIVDNDVTSADLGAIINVIVGNL